MSLLTRVRSAACWRRRDAGSGKVARGGAVPCSHCRTGGCAKGEGGWVKSVALRIIRLPRPKA
eukprot:13115815-Alexandrium_andersonii.AAC.1